MTNHRDPIEDWLSRDVEVMAPPPGSFQRVRSRARRRKAMQAASAAAGVAVIIAAGLSVPALTGNLFPGGGPARLGTSSPASGTQTPPRATSRPTPAAGARSFRGPQLRDAGSGPVPPPGFLPSSVTFVGNHPGYLGAVLGQAPCRGSQCTVIAGTRTYGARWTTVGVAPAGPLAVSQLRFADSQNGWAFGPGLRVTHNGGASWASATGVAGRVADLASVDGQVLAVAATGCTGTAAAQGTGYTAGCTGFGLYVAAITSDHFTRVLSKPGGGLVTPGGLQLQPTAQAGYLVAGGRLYSGALDGSGWNVVPPASSGNPGCLTGGPAAEPALLAAGAPVLYAACTSGQRLELYRSASSGRTWQAAGPVRVTGTATSLAVSPSGALVLATTYGLYYYSSAARTWKPAGGSLPGVAFRYVGMTTAGLGVAVPAAGQAAGDLFVTTDGGRTWQARPISQ